MRRFLPFLTLALAGAGAVSPAAAEEGRVRLVPHRAVYDLSLASARGARTIESARGRIAFELTGNACEGYALSFRQVTVLQSAEVGEKVSDLRTTNFESGDGASFRFRNETRSGEGEPQIVDGSADRKGDGITITLRSPKRDTVASPGAVVFPNTQMRDLVVAGRAGQSTLSEKVFDGSDDGRKIYETLAVIGKAQTGEAGLEAPAQKAGLAAMPRWPVSISYFDGGRSDGTPVYVLAFDLFENGISGALRLDYGDFALKGAMSQLELLPDSKTPCQR